MTPISHEPTPMPDPHARTELIRAALDKAIGDLQARGDPPADAAAAELCAIREALCDPPEDSEGLAALDGALEKTLHSVPALVIFAAGPEVEQSLKTLRRILLIDRRRIDPDPECSSLTLAIAMRRLWLISHRAGLLKARRQQLSIAQRIALPGLDPEEEKTLQETLSVLDQYIAAQEGYGTSVRQELDDLSARRLT